MATPLRELLAFFDIDVDSKKLDEADKKIEGFTDKLKKVGEVVAEAFALEKLKEFFGEQIRAGAQLQILSQRLGIAADDLESFQFAAGTAGIEAGQAAHSLQFLNRAIGQALTGNKEAAKTFALLGVHIREGTRVKDISELLPELADSFAKLGNDPRRAALAMQLFGRQGQQLLPLLSQGSEKIAELRKEAEELGSGLGNEYPKQAQAASVAIFKFHYALESLHKRITAAALPSLIRLFEALKRGVVTVTDFTKRTNVLQTGMAFLAAVATGKLLVSLVRLAKSFGLIQEGVLGTVAAFAKFAGPTAILYGLYLVLDDIYTWATGGKSVIGEALEQFEGADAAKALLRDLTGTVDDLMGAIRQIAPEFGGIRQAAAATFPYVGELVAGLIRGFLALVHTAELVGKTLFGLKQFAVAKTLKEELEALKQIGADYMDAGHQIARDLGLEKPAPLTEPAPVGPSERTGTGTRVPEISVNGLRKAHQAITASAPGVSATAPSVATPVAAGNVIHFTQENNLDVKVQGGNSPAQTGRAVGQGAMTEIEKQNDRALNALIAP